MQTPKKNYLIAFLALTTVAGGVIAWREFQELTTLRAQLLSKDERADWQKRLWSAEKQRSDLEKEVASLKSGPPSGEAPPDFAGPNADANQNRRNRRNDFMAFMDQPEMQRLVAAQQKAGLDSRYAALFKNLNLTPEQLDKFKNLLVEKRTAMMDVMAAAREQGINPRTNREAFDKLVADAQADIDASIKSTIGDAGYSQYQAYESSMSERNVISQLSQRLSYSATPLSDSQSEQLVAILSSTTTSTNQANGGRGMFFGPGGPGGAGGATITDATINQSMGVLTGQQVDALKQLQQEQQAQAELAAAMRDQFRQMRDGASGGNGSTSSAPPPPPPDGG